MIQLFTENRILSRLLPVLTGAFLLAAVLSGCAAPETPAPAETPPEEEAGFNIPEDGWFPAGGLCFRPEDPITRGEAADVFQTLTGERPDFGPEEDTLSELSFPVYLKRYFEPEAVAEAMSLIAGVGDSLISRSEATVCIHHLLGQPRRDGEVYFPDVAPDYWAFDAVSAAAETQGETEALPEGFVNLEGFLYLVDEDGYFLTNTWAGSLFFDASGRYTSGSKELDGYVAQAIAENTDETMTREEMLRSMYLYVRDSFSYLRRNYYNIGDNGWQMQEALTMYSTGKGNCYCYAAAFWAAARGLGYDAKIVSGTIGVENSPHGWVEMLHDGERYTYDVEIEMAQHRDGFEDDMYRMSDDTRRKWKYIEYNPIDNMIPRETEEALLPR